MSTRCLSIALMALIALPAYGVIVVPFWIKAKAGTEDSDGEDEITIHMGNGQCNAIVDRLKLKEGKGTAIPTGKLNYIAFKGSDMEFKLEEHDSFNNDHSNQLLLPNSQLKDIEKFLNSTTAKKKNIDYMVLALNFAVKGGISGFLSGVPFASLVCASPLMLNPQFALASKALTAYSAYKAVGGEGHETLDKAKEAKDKVSLCLEDAAALVSGATEYTVYIALMAKTGKTANGTYDFGDICAGTQTSGAKFLGARLISFLVPTLLMVLSVTN